MYLIIAMRVAIVWYQSEQIEGVVGKEQGKE